VEVAGVEVVAGQEVAEVEHAPGHDVDDVALTLDIPFGVQQGGVPGGGAVFVIDVGADDQVDDAGLVFEGYEDDSAGGAGALTDEDEAGDADPFALIGGAELVRGEDVEFVELFADEGDGVAFEGEAGGRVVGHDFLAEGHGRQ
jgi:hypothetical protein